MTLSKLHLERFTAFEKLDLELSPGLNVFIGENGTGKTHLLKILYASCDISKKGENFADKIVKVFLPSNRQIGRLVKRRRGISRSNIKIHRNSLMLSVNFSTRDKDYSKAKITGFKEWVRKENQIESVYIPVKEMLANAPGFRSQYTLREINFEEEYVDIIDRAYLPVFKGPMDQTRKSLMDKLHKSMEGYVYVKEQEFILRTPQGHFEFTLVAEGIRKLGLLYRLIQNGTLSSGSVVFWDEPETNLHPKMLNTVIKILMELQREGVQIFLATHNYGILKEIDLQIRPDDRVLFHALYRNSNTKEILCNSTPAFLNIDPNAILATFDDIYNREIERSLEGIKE